MHSRRFDFQRLLGWALLLTAVKPLEGFAELATETIDLQTGWNAVWLNLNPEPNDLGTILNQQNPGLNYQAIWMFDAGGATLGSTEPAGKWFFHERSLPSQVNNLNFLLGQRAYLIKMNAPGRLTLSGRPVARGVPLSSRVSNFLGALNNPDALVPLTFEHLFSHPNARNRIRESGAPAAPDIFRLFGNAFVRTPLTNTIQSNAAYWINVDRDFELRGPIDPRDAANGVDFGRTTMRKTLTVEIPASSTARIVTFKALPCATVSEANCTPAPGGAEWLEYRDPTLEGKAAWMPLTKGVSILVAAGQSTIELELRARRSGAMRGLSEGSSDSTFPAFLEIVDDRGGRSLLSTNMELQPIFGSWMGRATLTKVGTHPVIQNVPLDEAEASPFGMTLILDLPPSKGGAPAAPRLLDSIAFTTHRDGRPVVQRFNSVLFDRPVPLTENPVDPLNMFGESGTLSGEIVIGAEDTLNPYRHRYHAEHRRGFEIRRTITLVIERQPDTIADELAGLDGTLGSNVLTGTYTEVIRGVSLEPITVKGTFRLNRLVPDEVLP